MKIAITGKGGVGKTTLASSLARFYAAKGLKVLAVDADPDANLASGLGLPAGLAEKIVPLSQMRDLVEERTGAKPGGFGAFFKLNPRVDDIPDKFCTEIGGVKLLVMGKIEKGGEGCICPESVLLKTMLKHLLVERDEIVILDMEAGLEHLGRRTAESVDALIIVVEPDQRSLQTARAIEKLAQDIGVSRLFVVLNKITGKGEEEALSSSLKEFDILGVLSYSDLIRQANLKGSADYQADEAFWQGVQKVSQDLSDKLGLKQ